MKTAKSITIVLLISAAIIFWGWRESVWQKRFNAEQARIETIEEFQKKLNETGIGTPIKVDGRLGSETQKKWDTVNSRQLGDYITELCWTPSGAPRKE